MVRMVYDYNIMREVETFKKGMLANKLYTLIIKPWHKSRSLNQNSLFHAICAAIGTEDGTDPALIKEGIKEQYGVKERVELAKETHKVPKPSHLCDTKEMSLLIDGAIYEAAGLGIDVLIYQQEWDQIKNAN